MISLDEAMLYAPIEWQDCSEGYTDIRYQKSADGIAKITINRPQVRNAFRPLTVKEMIQALADARYDDNIGVIAGIRQRLDHLFDGQRAEGVAHLRTINGDFGNPVSRFVIANIGIAFGAIVPFNGGVEHCFIKRDHRMSFS